MNTINHTPTNTSLRLHRRDFFRAQKVKPGTTLICEQGILWLTQAEDLKDYMLKPGDKMVVKKKGSLLVEAMSDAHMCIVHNN